MCYSCSIMFPTVSIETIITSPENVGVYNALTLEQTTSRSHNGPIAAMQCTRLASS